MFVAAIVGQVVCFVSPPGWGWIPKPAGEISPGEGEFSRGRVFRGWGVRVCTSGGSACFLRQIAMSGGFGSLRAPGAALRIITGTRGGKNPAKSRWRRRSPPKSMSSPHWVFLAIGHVCCGDCWSGRVFRVPSRLGMDPQAGRGDLPRRGRVLPRTCFSRVGCSCVHFWRKRMFFAPNCDFRRVWQPPRARGGS